MADDTRVAKFIKFDEECACLQTDLNVPYEWSVTNKMTFNGDKFEQLVYVVSGDPVEFGYKTLNGSTINRTSKTTDLDVVMEDAAIFTDQIKEDAARAKQRLGWVLQVFTKRDYLPIMTMYIVQVTGTSATRVLLWCTGTIGMIKELEAVQDPLPSESEGKIAITIGGASNNWNSIRCSAEEKSMRYIRGKLSKV